MNPAPSFIHGFLSLGCWGTDDIFINYYELWEGAG